MIKNNAVFSIFAFLLLISCSGQDKSEPESVAVKDAWVREAPGGTRVTAGYMELHNMTATDDRLVGASCLLAAKTEIHLSYQDENNMAHMKKVDSVDIPSKGVVEFTPGGYHLMLMGIDENFNSNETVDIELQFENGGKKTVTAEVRGF